MANEYLDKTGLAHFWDNIKGEIGNASDAQVDDWLDRHPEATTTVQDGAITAAKLADGAVTTAKLADGSVTDVKLAQSGGVLSEVDNLKSSVSEVNKNLLDLSLLKNTQGITISDDMVVSGLASSFNSGFRDGVPVNFTFEENTRYTFSAKVKTLGESGTSNNGLNFVFYYTDQTSSRIFVKNNQTSYKSIDITSEQNKTVDYFAISFSNAGTNTWFVKDMQLEKGEEATEYIPHITGVDWKLRKLIGGISETYGLVGDGETDDTIALSSFINSSSEVILPKGTYLISSTIYISHDVKVVGQDGAVIYMLAQDETTYMFSATNVNVHFENVIFQATYNKPDASWFERISASVFSNVRAFEIMSCSKFYVTNCSMNYLEMLAECNKAEETETYNDTIYIDNVETRYTQMFIHCAYSKLIKIRNCNINHSNSSRLDHTFYIAQNNNDIYIDNVTSMGCYGISFSIGSVDGYSQTFNKLFITNSHIEARNGGITAMYGRAFVTGCVIKCTGNDSIALRNKGGMILVTNTEVRSAGYLLYSIVGTDAGVGNIPKTILKDIVSETTMIEGFQDDNSFDGERIFENCRFVITRSGNFNGAILCESLNSKYEITGCVFEREDTEGLAAVFYSEAGTAVEICKNKASEGLSLFNGLETNVIACDNIAYIEKGSLVGDSGLFVGNIILS